MKKILLITLSGFFVLTNCTKEAQKDADLANEIISSYEFTVFLNSFIDYVDLTCEAFESMTDDEQKEFFLDFDDHVHRVFQQDFFHVGRSLRQCFLHFF